MGVPFSLNLTLSSPERLTYAAPWQVRFVIGSGGATINTIRQETSTFIKSDRDEADPSAPVVFRIEGHSAEGVEAARVRIQEIVGKGVLQLQLRAGSSAGNICSRGGGCTVFGNYGDSVRKKD